MDIYPKAVFLGFKEWSKSKKAFSEFKNFYYEIETDGNDEKKGYDKWIEDGNGFQEYWMHYHPIDREAGRDSPGELACILFDEGDLAIDESGHVLKMENDSRTCKDYVEQKAKCSICKKSGHNSRTCQKEERYRCTICRKTGHNARTCQKHQEKKVSKKSPKKRRKVEKTIIVNNSTELSEESASPTVSEEDDFNNFSIPLIDFAASSINWAPFPTFLLSDNDLVV